MGDDLIFAQKFTRTAADGLALLVKMEDPRAAEDAAVVIDMMATLQRGAKRLRARHIYAGAQGVLSALHHETDAVLHGRITNLGSLVTKYARGLDELLQSTETAQAKTPTEMWSAARETLNGLLPTASVEDADMLSRLMRAPVTLETVHPKDSEQSPEMGSIQNEVIPFLKADTSLLMEEATIEPSETEDLALEELAIETPVLTAPQEKLAPLLSEDEAALSVTLDSMMRDVIAEALSVARAVGRTISLSYDMGNKTVSHARSEDLRDRLGQALSQIIRQSLTDGRVGHIDINLAGEQLHIIAGTTAMRLAIDPDATPKTTKPLINSDIEQGLRSQLDALMDPPSFHETAS